VAWYAISRKKDSRNIKTHSLFFLTLVPQTNSLFERELSSMNVSRPYSRFAPETYDAVWSIALALRGAEETWRNESRQNRKRKRKKLELFDYTRKDLVKDFLEQFSRLKFQGISVSLGEETPLRKNIYLCFSSSPGKCFVRRRRSRWHDSIPSNSIRPIATCCFVLS
jgi:hypothetical protein